MAKFFSWAGVKASQLKTLALAPKLAVITK